MRIGGGPPNCMAQVLALRLGQTLPQAGDRVAPLDGPDDGLLEAP